MLTEQTTLQRRPNMAIRTFIIDDQEVVRVGLVHALSQADDIQVVGAAAELDPVVKDIVEAKTEVLVVAFRVSQTNERATIALLRTQLPQVKILAFADQESPDMATCMNSYGALGFLDKNATMTDLAVGVRALHAGRVFISHTPEVTRKPYLELEARTSLNTAADLIDLTNREREVLQLLGEGLTNQEVADRLFLSVKTIETYRARVMKKHSLRSRSQLFELARRLESIPVTRRIRVTTL